jgi:hypothetical protein
MLAKQNILCQEDEGIFQQSFPKNTESSGLCLEIISTLDDALEKMPDTATIRTHYLGDWHYLHRMFQTMNACHKEFGIHDAAKCECAGDCYEQCYDACDDVASDEYIRKSLIRLLTDGWESFPQFIEISKQDQNFKKFILSHIKPISHEDEAYFAVAIENAKHQCPHNADVLCHEIVRTLRNESQKYEME